MCISVRFKCFWIGLNGRYTVCDRGCCRTVCVFHIFFYSYITSVDINFQSMLVILCIMPLRCSSVCFVWTAVPSVSLYCDHLHLCGALNSRCCYYTRCMSHAHCCITLWQIKRMHVYWTLNICLLVKKKNYFLRYWMWLIIIQKWLYYYQAYYS